MRIGTLQTLLELATDKVNTLEPQEKLKFKQGLQESFDKRKRELRSTHQLHRLKHRN